MQIHELPSASPSASDYIPIDNGTATRKATLSSIDMGSNEITFTSGDTSSPSSWQTVAVMASNTAANLMNAISKMVANIRWLYNRLGTSSTGTTATTVTGAIAEHSTKIGNADMGTTATTLTGAIAEVNDSVSDNSDAIAELNSNLNDLNSHVDSALATPLAIYRNSNNGTTYTFPCVRKESGSYSYFLMIGGAGSSAAFVYHGFVSVNSTGNVVTLAKIGGASALTFTASYNGTDTLTITASATAYGGIRLIWFS